jgi:queuosine precursor transporter
MPTREEAALCDGDGVDGVNRTESRSLTAARMRTAVPYVGTVVALNVGFSFSPDLDWFFSLLVGMVLVLRDFAQRVWGHACLALMALAALLSYLLGSHEVALASASAFAVSETVDWLVYTVTRRPFADRVLLSTAASAPVDSAVFLVLANLFTWPLFFIGLTSKCTAGVIIWSLLRWRARARPADAAIHR